MKHLEGLDSIIVAAFIGGFVIYLYNQVDQISENNASVIGAGAAVGASVQLVLRMTGAS